MKNLFKAISKIAGVIALAIFLTACNKSYKAILADNEGTPNAVAIDGRPDSGKVKRVYVDASGRRVVEFTVSRDAENLIRQRRTVRRRHPDRGTRRRGKSDGSRIRVHAVRGSPGLKVRGGIDAATCCRSLSLERCLRETHRLGNVRG